MGYSSVSTRDILQHLFDNYGVITPQDLDNNDARMREPFNPTVPIETYFHQVEKTRAFAEAANDPYTDRQVVNIGLSAMQRTGVLNNDCKAWKKLSDKEHTWVAFKKHFAIAHREYKDNLATATKAGFAGSLTIDEIREEANSAALAATDSTIADLEANNAKLVAELEDNKTKFLALAAKVDSLAKAPPLATPPGKNSTGKSNSSSRSRPSKRICAKRYDY